MKADTKLGTMAHAEPAEDAARSAAPTRFVPDTMEEVQRVARMFYYGGLMKKTFYKNTTPEGVRCAIAGISTMILYGAELGLSPMQAMRSMHVIEGQASLSAEGCVAILKRSPRCLYFRVVEESDNHCIAETVRIENDGAKSPAHRLEVKIWWNEPKDIPEPKKGLLYVLPTYDRDGKLAPAWQRTPGRMVKARCTMWLAHNVYEDVVLGLYSTEEVIDFADRRSSDRMVDDIFAMVDDTPAKPGQVEASDEEPAARPEPTQEPVPATPAKPGLTPADLKALMKRIEDASDSITPDEVAVMRASVEAFNGVAPVGYPNLIKAWNANEVLGPYEVGT